MDKGKLFRRLGLTTVVAVYLLILVGGIVRATGAGMGCPDWPKCFGTWIPPTAEEQLPDNYKEIFGAKLKGEVIFNPVKTWIEYINRLLGVLIGFFIFGTFIASVFTYFRKDNLIVSLSFLAFVLVAFEGWLGSKVVSTELHAGLITLHMLLSIIIVGILLYIVARSYDEVLGIEYVNKRQALNFLLVTLIILSVGQVLLGTQVREGVDEIIVHQKRELTDGWLSEIGGKFYMHLVLSVIIVGIHIFLYRKIKTATTQKGLLERVATILIFVIIVETLSGSLMALFKIPSVAQPIHLFFGVAVLGIQFTLFLLLNREYIGSRTKNLA